MTFTFAVWFVCSLKFSLIWDQNVQNAKTILTFKIWQKENQNLTKNHLRKWKQKLFKNFEQHLKNRLNHLWKDVKENQEKRKTI